MQFSNYKIHEALIEMLAKAMAISPGHIDCAVSITIEDNVHQATTYSMHVGEMSREPRNGDPGRNYPGTAWMKLAFSQRTHLPSGKYKDLPAKIGETDLKGCVPHLVGGEGVYFVCAGLQNEDDDVIVCKAGAEMLLN